MKGRDGMGQGKAGNERTDGTGRDGTGRDGTGRGRTGLNWKDRKKDLRKYGQI